MNRFRGLFEFRTMRARLLSWLLLLNMIPVLLLVVIGLGYAERQLQHDVAEETRRLSLNLVRAMDQDIEQKLEAARILARSTYLQEAFQDFIQVFRTSEKYSMEYQLMEDKYWPYLSYYAEKRGLSDLLLISNDGNVVFSAAQSTLYSSNITNADNLTALHSIFRKAVTQSDSVIVLNPDASEQAAYIAAPVFDQTLIGIVVFVPDNEKFLQEFNRNLGGGQTMSLYLPASDGQFYLWPEQIMTEQGSTLNRVLSAAYLGNPMYGELELNDTKWLFSARTLPAVDGVLIVQRDKYTSLAAIYELRVSASVGAGILIIILIFAARRVSNNVTYPLKELTENLQKIGEGQRQLRADESRRDELGALAREFNRMTRSLRQTQAQLVESEKMASIGHLASGVAHEINNPLSVVNANLNMLDEYLAVYNSLVEVMLQYFQENSDSDPSARQQLLDEMYRIVSNNDMGFIYRDTESILKDSRQGLERVRKIIGNLQVFAELGSDELQPVDLQQCLEHTVAQVEIPDKSNVRVHYDIRLTEPVRMRPEEMRKVFLAVLDNAFRACLPAGEILLRAYTQKGQVMMEFCDTGPGMPESELKKIFNPFYTTRAVGDGMGLGLSVAHAIVGAHGGSIRIDSKEGKGTIVRIRIPA